MSFSLVAGVVSLSSNIVVMLMFVKFRELRTATNAIIINLAFTDIGVAGIGYPMSAASDMHGSWKFGYTGCQVCVNKHIKKHKVMLIVQLSNVVNVIIAKVHFGRSMMSTSGQKTFLVLRNRFFSTHFFIVLKTFFHFLKKYNCNIYSSVILLF